LQPQCTDNTFLLAMHTHTKKTTVWIVNEQILAISESDYKFANNVKFSRNKFCLLQRRSAHLSNGFRCSSRKQFLSTSS